MKTAIIGATGYTGLELVRILIQHPGVEITALTSERYSGQPFSAVYPSLEGLSDIILEAANPSKIVEKADFFFTAVPHKEAMRIVPVLHGAGKKVVDLSADFRFSHKETYEKWYQRHTSPGLLAEAVYGLPEANREAIKTARIVANPGCYPTSVILPLLPFLKKGLIELDGIIADSKSGVSGAGRSARTASLFAEISESFKAYNILQHRHGPEIDEQLSSIAGKPVSIAFVPHLVPMNRGMLSTIYVTLTAPADDGTARSVLEEQYSDEKFVRILPEGTLPQTGRVRGTNFCDIGFRVQGTRLVLVSAIDNLTKGASGQAVQNMNIMQGYSEGTALDLIPLYP